MSSNWEHKKLGEVCYKITDGTHVTPTYTREGVPFLSVKNLTKGFIDFSDTRFISLEEHQALTKRCKPVRDDILYTKVGTTGIAKVVDVDDEFSIFVSIALLKVKHEIIFNRFLEHFLNSPFAREQAQKRTRGMANKNLVITDIKQIDIRFPKALPEQQRLVAILDQAFAAIATAKANTKKNLQNARALFESHLQGVFSQRGEGWVEKPLDEICEVKDGTHDSPKYVPDGIPFVTQKNIKLNGLSLEDTRFIDQADHDKFYKRSNVAYGDILISMIGANRGMACIVDDNRIFSIKNVGLVKQNDSINQRFLLYFLKSSMAADYVMSRSKGGAQEFIGLTELRNFPIIMPSISEQERIVAKMDILLTETQHLESIYRQKLAALDELKKSLLHQAFSGEL